MLSQGTKCDWTSSSASTPEDRRSGEVFGVSQDLGTGTLRAHVAHASQGEAIALKLFPLGSDLEESTKTHSILFLHG